MAQQPSARKAKQQSTFDPSELDDLIFTPAVGSGVASHLLRGPSSQVATEGGAGTALAPEINSTPVVATQLTPEVMWTTASGDLIAAKKVRRIQAATDALSAAEEKVYQVLWNTVPGPRGEGKSVQAGYEYLTRKTRFSRKTIQRTIDKLIEKGFLTIETPGDSYTRGATIYRVHAPGEVLVTLQQRNRLHVAKIGPGVVFCAPPESRPL